MVLQPVWTEETYVKSFETDFRQGWKLSAFFQWMQEAATRHASHLGFDYVDMFAKDQTWVLSRMKIQFLTLPRLREMVQIQTWPKGIQQKLFFMRDFKITRPDGSVYALATSAWLLINVKERRMLLPQALEGELPRNEGRHALDEPLEKISLPGDAREAYSLTAGYSAVDMMGHVNNARYIDWLADCFSIDTYRQKQMDWLQINYSTEVRPGESVTLAVKEDPANPNLVYIQGNNQTTGTRAFEAAACWKA